MTSQTDPLTPAAELWDLLAPAGQAEALDERGDETAVVLAVLRVLARHVACPVLRVCLEECHTDVAHLLTDSAELPPAA
jgi:hypothetical protein